MNDLPALLAACVANPADDTARLVLADWYGEHGTTDREAARSEWIRLTCSKVDRDRSHRQRGEPRWIRDNCHRLWPALCERYRNPDIPSYMLTRIKFMAGEVILRTYAKEDHGKHGAVSIAVHCERGVTSRVEVPFLRASQVVADIARDEPHARIEFAHIPTVVIGFGIGQTRGVRVFSNYFSCRGLDEVFDGLEGWSQEGDANPGKYRLYSKEFHRDPRTVATNSINASLTRYARKRAGLPQDHLIPIAPTEEPQSDEKLDVPPKVA